MKKILMFITTMSGTCLFPSLVNAQLQQGTIMVGGQLANLDFGLGSASYVRLQMTPKAGYFVRNNLVLGAEAPMGFNVVKNMDPIFNYGAGVFIRYYFAPREFNIDNVLRRGRFFVEGGAGVAGQTDVEVGANIRAGAGYAYFLSPNIALETSAMYQGTYGTGNVSGLLINLGFQIHLPTSKIRAEYYRMKSDME